MALERQNSLFPLLRWTSIVAPIHPSHRQHPMAVRLPPIGFWSYARQDDVLSSGRLSSLRALLQSELQQQYGREPILLFQDQAAIPTGAEWESEIRNNLARSTFLIPIITPNFIQSQWCTREIEIFLEREKQLNAQYKSLNGARRIFPILYIDADSDPYSDKILAELHRLQWFDFRALRFKDQREEAVQVALGKLASTIRGLLHMRVPSEEDQAAELALHQAEQAEAQRAQEALIEAQRVEAERIERQRIEDERAERARQEAARVEAERARRAQAETDRIARAVRESEEQAAIDRRQVRTRERNTSDHSRAATAPATPSPSPPPIAPNLQAATPRAVMLAGGAASILLLIIVIAAFHERMPDDGPGRSVPGDTSTSASIAPADPSLTTAQDMAGRWAPKGETNGCAEGSAEAITIDVEQASAAWTIKLNGEAPQPIPTVQPGGWLPLDHGLWRVQDGDLQIAAQAAGAMRPADYSKCP